MSTSSAGQTNSQPQAVRPRLAAATEATETTDTTDTTDTTVPATTSCATDDRAMPCPVCGHQMPDLKGGKASICPVCGFKDSCCF